NQYFLNVPIASRRTVGRRIYRRQSSAGPLSDQITALTANHLLSHGEAWRFEERFLFCSSKGRLRGSKNYSYDAPPVSRGGCSDDSGLRRAALAIGRADDS